MPIEIPWIATFQPDGREGDFVPAILAWLDGVDDRVSEEVFVIDSGADISMAPRRVLDELGFQWDLGQPMTLHGISPRPECAVDGKVFEVEAAFPDMECSFPIPICFAEGDVTCLLGRQVFFDVFEIIFRKANRVTSLELLL